MKHNFDIDEDEIRIINGKTDPIEVISQCSRSCQMDTEPRTPNRKRSGKGLIITAVAIAVLAIVALIVWQTSIGSADTNEVELVQEDVPVAPAKVAPAEPAASVPGYVNITDTIVGDNRLTILCPENAVATLEVGPAAMWDSTAVLLVPAADIRQDNGAIVGAFVRKGELLSRGKSKAGFCAIINGEITVGVSDASPLLEEAIATEGYFFRQYPLVVGGQIVENKPKGTSKRKALATLNGKTVVVMSTDKLSFHDFSQALVDLGVTNAIYLIGSSSYGFGRTANGDRFIFGKPVENLPENFSFIVWR